MTSATVASLLLRQPFQPFSFVFPDHTEVFVSKPSEVSHQPGNRIVTVVTPDRHEYIIDLDLVSLIDVRPLR